jgi:hypothetical protein
LFPSEKSPISILIISSKLKSIEVCVCFGSLKIEEVIEEGIVAVVSGLKTLPIFVPEEETLNTEEEEMAASKDAIALIMLLLSSDVEIPIPPFLVLLSPFIIIVQVVSAFK